MDVIRGNTSKLGWVLGLLVALHLGYSWLLSPTGHLTYDSGTYHWMVKNWTQNGGFHIDNGPPEIRDEAFRVAQLRWHDNQLAGQYPEFYTFLLAPFYLLFGFAGFKIANSLFFLGTNYLIWKIARFYSTRRGFPLSCVLIYSFATFAWNYSQSEYPHLTATFFIACSFWLALLSLQGQHRTGWALLSGAALGLATGIRYDSLYAAVGISWLLAGMGPHRVGRCLAWALGGLPFALALSWINQNKFGVFFPATYGTGQSSALLDASSYYPVLILAVLVVFCLLFHRRIKQLGQNRSLLIAAIAGLVIVVLLIAPVVLPILGRVLHGAYQLAIDMRIRDMSILEPALERSENGAMIYISGVKKSLLQSMPFLALPLVRLFTRPRQAHDLHLAAWLIPGGYLAFFGLFAWHGSIALNMRYFNPALPFFAILTALAWQHLRPALQLSLFRRWRLAFFFWLLLLVIFVPVFDVPTQEVLFLNIPLALAGMIAAMELARRFGFLRLRSRGQAFLVLFAMCWASAMVVAKDHLHEVLVRYAHASMSEKIAPYFQSKALFVTEHQDLAWPLLDQVDELQVYDPNLADHERMPDQLIWYRENIGPVYLLILEEANLPAFPSTYRLKPSSFEIFGNEKIIYELQPSLEDQNSDG